MLIFMYLTYGFYCLFPRYPCEIFCSPGLMVMNILRWSLLWKTLFLYQFWKIVLQSMYILVVAIFFYGFKLPAHLAFKVCAENSAVILMLLASTLHWISPQHFTLKLCSLVLVYKGLFSTRWCICGYLSLMVSDLQGGDGHLITWMEKWQIL